VEKTLDAPLDRVWALLADFSNLDWYEGAERVEAVGQGIGQIRRVFIPGMASPVEEQLLASDADHYRLEYQVLDGGSNILRDYRVIATLRDAGAGRTLARWNAAFSGVTVEGVKAQDMAGTLRDVYAGMALAIARAAR
jgi:hypothetical protein